VAKGVKLSLSSSEMSLVSFLRWVSDKTGVSVVCDAKLDAKTVTVDIVEQDVDSILSVVARRLGVMVTRSGNLYFIGELRKEDRGVLVRKVRRLSMDELKSCVSVLMSEVGQIWTYEDGLLVLGDRVEVLGRINDMLDQVEAAPNDSWVVQLWVMTLDQSAQVKLGLDGVPQLELSAKLASGKGGEASIVAGFKGVLQASASASGVRMVAQPLFVVLDGQSCSLSKVQSIPVPRQTVSDSGTVTTTGYDQVEAGLIVKLTIRETSRDTCKLTLHFELSDVAGYVETYPIKFADTFDTISNIRSGSVYLLGSLQRQDRSKRLTGLVSVVIEESKSDGLLQVWGKAYRVSGGAIGG
jgi:type II secretory pathway component GspD/PulD (secretin)